MKYHQNLTLAKWQKLSLIEQMANVGSEILRTISWRNKNRKYSRLAFERALELLNLTLADSKNKKRLKEIARAREMLADYFVFDNEYSSTEKFWQKYFLAFNWAARDNLSQ